MANISQKDVLNPHFRLPLQFGGINGGAIVNEQDDSDDVMDCVRAIVAFPVGARVDNPEFGIPDLLFKEYDQSAVDQVRAAIDEWEDRVSVDVESSIPVTDQLIWNLLVKVRVTTEQDDQPVGTGMLAPSAPVFQEPTFGIDGGVPSSTYIEDIDGGSV
jgi:phage baseplate assembly protein W